MMTKGISYTRFFVYAVLLPAILFCSCKKFVEIPLPETELTAKFVFEEDATAIAAVSGIYNKMAQQSNWASGGNASISFLESLYSDEMRSYAAANSNSLAAPFFYNNLLVTNSNVLSTWSSCYNIIYSANRVIDGLNTSTSVSENTHKQLMGEVLFIRAFCHFYLENLFGPIPYIVTTDYRTNTTVARNSSDEIYQGIIMDLTQAQGLLVNAYPGTGQRVRINKGAATALLARVYLYRGKWADAEAQASILINNTAQYELLADLNTVFLKNSREAIWQLIPAVNALQTHESGVFILVTTPSTKASMTDALLNSFETNDKRRTNWVDTLTVGLSSWYFPFKYKENVLKQNANGNEYSMVLRLAEQYLIRAEARAMQDKLSEAAADINAIRHRAGLGNTPAATQSELIAAIENEKRKEFFTEWGHRFFDLKRWNKLDAVLGTVKSGWNSTDALWPIPQSEILKNENLTQNAGY